MAHEKGAWIAGHGDNRTVRNSFGSVRHDHFRVNLQIDAQTGAGRASPIRRVERKHARRDFRQTDPAIDAGEIFAERQFLRAVHIDVDQAFTQFQRRFQRFSQTAGCVFLYDDPVDHDFQRMLPVLIEFDLFAQLTQFAIDAHPHVAILADFIEQFGVFAFLAANHRRQQRQFRPFALVHQRIHHLLHRLLGNRLAALGAVRSTGPGIEQSQIIIDFGHCPHSGTRVAAGRLLVDRNGRRQPFDIIDIRFVHLAEKLAGIGRQ